MGEVPLYDMRPQKIGRVHARTEVPRLQGYLADKKAPPARTPLWAYVLDPMVVPGRGAMSYARCIPVRGYLAHKKQHPPKGPP